MKTREAMKNLVLVSVVFALSTSLLAQTPRPAPQFKGIFEPVNYPEDVSLSDVFFVSADVGWAAGGTGLVKGGVIINTRDGGQTWNTQYGDPQSSDPAVRQLRFLDEKTGWAVQNTGGPVRLLHTLDGENWIAAGTMGQNFTDYAFTSERTGVFVEGRVMQRTEDGGKSWKPVSTCSVRVEVKGLTRSVNCTWMRIQFVTPMLGYAVASSSTEAKDIVILAKTEDGGATWTIGSAPAVMWAEDAYFVNEKVGYVRLGSVNGGQLYRTQDGGLSWTGMAASLGARIAFADPEVGWAFNYNKFVFTTDGGGRWNSRDMAFPAQVRAFSLPRRDRGYVVGEHGMVFRYRVVPVAENVPKSIAAPLMPIFDSPLDDQVAKLESQLAALEKSAAAPVGAADALPPAVVQQLNAVEATLTAASTEAPQFAAKFKNMNLVAIGLQMVTELPAQVQGLRESLQALKQGRSFKSTASALPELRAKTEGLSLMVRRFFQKQEVAK
jgi:photosystem II stability/assembly factor-like uncharacterized protein